jgi:hypothetical protein
VEAVAGLLVLDRRLQQPGHGEITKSVDPNVYTGKVQDSLGATAPDAPEIRCCFMNSVAEPEFTSDQTLGHSEKYEGQIKKGLMNNPAFNMGTGFGQHETDRVTEELFERGAELETLLDLLHRRGRLERDRDRRGEENRGQRHAPGVPGWILQSTGHPVIAENENAHGGRISRGRLLMNEASTSLVQDWS